MNADTDKIIFAADSMPTLPVIYNKIKEAVEDPNTSFEDIAYIVSNDPALSARLLRIANSAFYGYPSAVTSIADALTVIGLQQFKNMALSTCIMGLFDDIPSSVVDMEQFWRKSIACGLCARSMALQLRESNSERFFLGGLLHRIGQLIIFKEEPQRMLEAINLVEEKQCHIIEAEEEVFGFNHASVSGSLLEYWNLADSLIEFSRYYHRPALAPGSVPHVSLIHLADFITEALELGCSGERFVPAFSDAAWEHSGLDASSLFFIVEDLERQYEEICKILLED